MEIMKDLMNRFVGIEVSRLVDKHLPADGTGTSRERKRIEMHHDISRLLLNKQEHLEKVLTIYIINYKAKLELYKNDPNCSVYKCTQSRLQFARELYDLLINGNDERINNFIDASADMLLSADSGE